MKKIFKKFWATQGCQETPLNIGVLLIFGGVSWHPWVTQNFTRISSQLNSNHHWPHSLKHLRIFELYHSNYFVYEMIYLNIYSVVRGLEYPRLRGIPGIPCFQMSLLCAKSACLCGPCRSVSEISPFLF